MNTRRLFLIGFLLVMAFVLVACGGAEETPPVSEPEPTEAPAEPTEAPEPTAAPAEPTEEPQPEVAAEPVPGVTDDSIVLGMTNAESGPVSAIGIPLSRGLVAYFNWINEQGGVHGRQIQFLVEDDQYNPSNTVAVTRKLVEEDGVFAIVRPLGTGPGASVIDYLVENEVPVVGIASGSSLWSDPHKPTYFGIQPTYALEGRLMAQYALDVLGAERIGVFFQNDAFGKEGADSFVAALAERGVEPVVNVPYEATETDFSSHALALQEADPDLVFVYAIVVPASSLLTEAQKNGFEPTWLMTYVLADPILPFLAGEAAEGAQAGAWIVDPLNAPEAQQYRDVLAQEYPEEIPGGYSLSSWAVGEIIVEALNRAGPDLTREEFVAALESLQDFSTGLTPAFSYSADDHQGIKQMAIVELQGGVWIPVTDFFGEE
ncbi:MAG: ABC transporter substrate-binding protein [Anaerolineae bacterium]